VTPGRALDLVFDPTPLAISRLAADAPEPAWAHARGRFVTVTRTPHELSITCEARLVPADVHSEGPFVSFRVRGALDFGQVGVIAALAGPLAEAGIPIFVVATFDTDYVLVPLARHSEARTALAAAGHRVETSAGC
jgi:hypothetical protein